MIRTEQGLRAYYKFLEKGFEEWQARAAAKIMDDTFGKAVRYGCQREKNYAE